MLHGGGHSYEDDLSVEMQHRGDRLSPTSFTTNWDFIFSTKAELLHEQHRGDQLPSTSSPRLASSPRSSQEAEARVTAPDQLSPTSSTITLSACWLLRVASILGIADLVFVYLIGAFYEIVDEDGASFDPPKYCIPAWPLKTISQYSACYPSVYVMRSGMLSCCVFLALAGFAMRHSFPFRVWVFLPIAAFGLSISCTVSWLENDPLHTACAFVFFIGSALFEAGVSHCAFVFEREKREITAIMAAAVTDQGSSSIGMAAGRKAHSQIITKQRTCCVCCGFRQPVCLNVCCGFKRYAFREGLSPGGTWPCVLTMYSLYFVFCGSFIATLGWCLNTLNTPVVAAGEWSLMLSVFGFGIHLSFIID